MRSEEKQAVRIAANATPDRLISFLTSNAVLWFGTFLALISAADGVRNSILHSLDFQWSPAWLLTRHIDPWTVYLAGDPGHRILLNQVPNYLHELYIILLPFGYLPYLPAKLLWAAINLALVLMSCAWVARLYELKRREAWLLAVLVLSSTPFRVTLGNGQITALVLACLALWAIVASSTGRGLLLGMSWAKYSVPPVLAAFLLLRRRWRLLAFSLVVPIAGFLFLYAWLRTPFWTLLSEPFRASTNNVSPGLANIMAIAEIALRHPSMFRPIPDAFYFSPQGTWAAFVPYACGVLLALAIAISLFFQGKNVDGRVHLACLTAASLLCFKHQIYDFLLLIFCLALALKTPLSRARNLLLLLIAYFWYVERLAHIRRWEFWPAVVVLSFILLAALIASAWRLRGEVGWAREWML